MGLFGHKTGEEVLPSDEDQLKDWICIDTRVETKIDSRVEKTGPSNLFINLKFEDFLHNENEHQEDKGVQINDDSHKGTSALFVNLKKKTDFPIEEVNAEEPLISENEESPINQVEEDVCLPTMKFKEIKYGMSVLINTGNFENVRTHVEVTAEIEEVTKEEELRSCINVLRKQILEVGRNEYKEIKYKQTKK